MGTSPVGPLAAPAWMTAAAVAGVVVLTLLFGRDDWQAVLLGSAGPLVAAAATWIVVERVHRREPAGVSAAMIKLFAAKMLFFGVYVAAAVALLPVEIRAFVVSFTSQYIMLHFMEAIFLRRLFAAPEGRRGVD